MLFFFWVEEVICPLPILRYNHMQVSEVFYNVTCDFRPVGLKEMDANLGYIVFLQMIKAFIVLVLLTLGILYYKRNVF